MRMRCQKSIDQSSFDEDSEPCVVHRPSRSPNSNFTSPTRSHIQAAVGSLLRLCPDQPPLQQGRRQVGCSRAQAPSIKLLADFKYTRAATMQCWQQARRPAAATALGLGRALVRQREAAWPVAGAAAVPQQPQPYFQQQRRGIQYKRPKPKRDANKVRTGPRHSVTPFNGTPIDPFNHPNRIQRSTHASNQPESNHTASPQRPLHPWKPPVRDEEGPLQPRRRPNV